MMKSRILHVSDASEWNDLVASCTAHDVYHLAEYHQVAERQGEGRACLFVLETENRLGLLPFVERAVAGLPWIAESDLVDATSVYGYAGALSNLDLPDPDFAGDFQRELLQILRQQRVVSLFSRLHPLIDNSWLLRGEAEIPEQGSTVSIRLDGLAGPHVLLQQMSTNHRRDVQKLRDAGVRVEHDPKLSALNVFIDAYTETMRRNNADARYFFQRDYFQDLHGLLDGHLHLFVARSSSGAVLSSALIFSCGEILQYHLGATPDEYVRQSAIKLVLAEVARWGMERGYRWLHLGGGVGAAADDGVFRFKRGFSDNTHPFRTARLIVIPEIYDQLVARRAGWAAASTAATNYFPAYRHPG
jgi:hypothetical protein